jgi:hypothetical protein
MTIIIKYLNAFPFLRKRNNDLLRRTAKIQRNICDNIVTCLPKARILKQEETAFTRVVNTPVARTTRKVHLRPLSSDCQYSFQCVLSHWNNLRRSPIDLQYAHFDRWAMMTNQSNSYGFQVITAVTNMGRDAVQLMCVTKSSMEIVARWSPGSDPLGNKNNQRQDYRTGATLRAVPACLPACLPPMTVQVSLENVECCEHCWREVN